ncbi:Thrombospondin type 3 repeat-containing protein [Fibrobacter sp. UWH9]|nr:Thrombospondin type 3 repeat-containing protein [Fibrobacter sp. UWH9]
MKRLVSILFVFCAMVVAQPLDGDSDGVPNDIDQCPNTRPGTPVDSLGCPLDSDHDGVYDTRDLCPGTEPGTPVDQTGCPLDTDGDGVPDYLDKCPNSPVGALVNERGCVRDDDGDGVPDQLDKCPNTPYDAIVDSVGCPVSRNSTLDYLRGRIDFQTGSAKLTKASFSALDSLVDILIGAPTIKLEIEGHVDNAGPENINLMLSQERAQSVVDYLVGKGIDARRLKAVGLGSSRPVADNGTLQGRKANRRIEFIVW